MGEELRQEKRARLVNDCLPRFYRLEFVSCRFPPNLTRFSIKCRKNLPKDYANPPNFLAVRMPIRLYSSAPTGKRIKITYEAAHHTEILSDPEEIVRAEFWAELIYRYGYDAKRIAFEQPVPARTNKEKVDLILFHDDELTRPFAVIECKRDGISDTEFLQAVEQVFGYGIAQKFRPEYVMIVAGLTRRVYDCSDRFGVLEREKNRVAGLPLKGKKPVEFRYVDGGEIDLRAIPGLALGATLKKCHDTLWGGGRLSAGGIGLDVAQTRPALCLCRYSQAVARHRTQ